MARKQRRLGRQVLKGAIGVDQARAKLGKAPVTKAAAPEPEVTQPVTSLPEPDVIAKAVKAATAPLLKRQARQDKALRRQAKVLDAIADQRDTSAAPFRGAGVAKMTSAAPAGSLTAAQSAEQAQTAHLQRLHHEWRSNPNPEMREAAYREMTAQLGLNPMTGPNSMQTPMT